MTQDVVEAGRVAPFLLRSRPDDEPIALTNEGKTHQKVLTKLEPSLIITQRIQDSYGRFFLDNQFLDAVPS